ncbi:MATE family efflux transporter [Paraflavitalea pollutisoli]|uniref:MATE family efflux transporter n=1 Tax=Paraflavitalea pollutisoli TaxID=3034143 RepID=UPI0023ECBD49|nr:MATE family efflux transporter [Paraflavitalea sp. H1-2-19X]
MPLNATNSKTSVWSFIKQSLTSEHQDFTQGSIRRGVLMLAIPMILEMMMESVFAVVDIYFVGRIEHARQAVSTVVLTESVLTILYSVAMALSMGATAVVARRVGEKNIDLAAKSAAQAINLALIITVVISLAGGFGAPWVLKLMGGSPEVVEMGTPYTRIMFGGSAVIMLLFLINGIFRGAGNAAIAMWSLWLANGCNIILCPILIHYYGLTGAAIATTIGRGVGVLYQLYHLFKGKSLLRIRRPHFDLDLGIFKTLFDLSWVVFFQFFIASASWMFLARLITRFGDEAVAGYGVAIRILMFFLLPAWGMSNAAATLVGQNLGAQQPERAEQSVWKTAKYNAIFMAGVILLFLLGGDLITSFMNKDAGVVKVASQALHIVSLGYIFYGVGMVVTSAFNGAGDTKTPTYINFVGFWLFQIPLAYFLSVYLGWGPTGVFTAILTAEAGISIAGVIIFRRGAWKNVKI